uniref:Putative animal peptidoglycan recognition protein similar to bacteriophage t3 lysozyme n=1 Tax=Anopheles aquasalis TaxID=42839 RepID=T1DN61_ANOAQ
MNKFAALLVAASACLAGVSAQCPRIVTRAQWGARAANTAQLPIRPAPWVVMHHTAGAHCTTDAACNQQMRNIQSFHMDGNGWADIGYNFLVGENGAAYEGRGWGRQGAHAPGYNDRSVGMGVMGTFTNGIPNAAARNAAQQLISCGVSLGHIASNYWLIGHRQAVATACPGNAFFNEIRNWPRFNPNFLPFARTPHTHHNHFKPLLLLRPRVIYHLQLCSARLDRKYGVEPEMCFLWPYCLHTIYCSTIHSFISKASTFIIVIIIMPTQQL